MIDLLWLLPPSVGLAMFWLGRWWSDRRWPRSWRELSRRERLAVAWDRFYSVYSISADPERQALFTLLESLTETGLAGGSFDVAALRDELERARRRPTPPETPGAAL